MSQTIDGYFFTCKSCGKTHFYSQKPRSGIRLSCVHDKYAIRTYFTKDFKNYWHGSSGDVSNIIVRENY